MRVTLTSRRLRRALPVRDVQGRDQCPWSSTSHPPQKLTPPPVFELRQLAVTSAATPFQPHWGDGHASGILSFQYLRDLDPDAPPEVGDAAKHGSCDRSRFHWNSR